MGTPRQPRVHRCPYCRGREVERRSRRGLERLYLALIGRRAYQCLRCNRRFYDRPV